MSPKEWKTLIKPVNDQLYTAMLDAIGCGPYDGGCVTFAMALQDVIGGDLYVVINGHGRASHAAVYLDGLLWDHAGPREPQRFLYHFNRTEHLRGANACAGFRSMADRDLPGAPRDERLKETMVTLLREAWPEAEREPAPGP